MEKALAPYYWPSMRIDLDDFLDCCACSVCKQGRGPRKEQVLYPVVSQNPLEIVAGDVYSYGGVCYLTVMDLYSGYPDVFSMASVPPTTSEIAKGVRRFESQYGNISRYMTDRGGEFAEVTWVQRIRTSADHPQTNGKLERFHGSLGDLSRTHNLPCDQAVEFYRTPLMRTLFFEHRQTEGIPIDCSGTIIPSRSFRVGELVRRKIPRRRRAKSEPLYSFWRDCLFCVERIFAQAHLQHQ